MNESIIDKEVTAHIEWIVGIIRTGKEFKKFGDPYEFVCSVVREGNEAHLKGAVGEFNLPIRRALKKALVEQGITKVTWERVNNTPRKLSAEI